MPLHARTIVPTALIVCALLASGRSGSGVAQSPDTVQPLPRLAGVKPRNDIDELFDLRADPQEMHNLAYAPEQAPRAKQMSAHLFDILGKTGGRTIPLYPDSGFVMNYRTPVPGAEQAAPFPPELVLKPGAQPYRR